MAELRKTCAVTQLAINNIHNRQLHRGCVADLAHDRAQRHGETISFELLTSVGTPMDVENDELMLASLYEDLENARAQLKIVEQRELEIRRKQQQEENRKRYEAEMHQRRELMAMDWEERRQRRIDDDLRAQEYRAKNAARWKREREEAEAERQDMITKSMRLSYQLVIAENQKLYEAAQAASRAHFAKLAETAPTPEPAEETPHYGTEDPWSYPTQPFPDSPVKCHRDWPEDPLWSLDEVLATDPHPKSSEETPDEDHWDPATLPFPDSPVNCAWVGVWGTLKQSMLRCSQKCKVDIPRYMLDM